MATASTVDVNKVIVQPIKGGLGDGKVEIQDRTDEKMSYDENAAKTVDVAVPSAGLEHKQQPHPPPADVHEHTPSSSSGSSEKEENVCASIIINKRGDDFENGFNENGNNGESQIRMIKVKKKKARRASLNEFFQKAAAVAAAREEMRPKTRHGGRREGTNHYGANGVLKKPTPTNPHNSNSSSSSSSSSRNSRGKKDKRGKRKGEKAGHVDNENAPPSKKQKQTPGPPPPQPRAPEPVVEKRRSESLITSPNVSLVVAPATTLSVKSTSTSSGAKGGKGSNTKPKKPEAAAAAAAAATTAQFTPRAHKASTTQNNSGQNPTSSKPKVKRFPPGTPLVDLPYRPDTSAPTDFPVITLPRANDVLFGRGSRVALHRGNQRFRIHVRNNKDRYLSFKRTQKVLVAREVVELVVADGGRFLELDGPSVLTGPWRHATVGKCLEKTSQALREQKWGAGNSPSNRQERLIPVEDSETLKLPLPELNPSPVTKPGDPSSDGQDSVEGSDNKSSPGSASGGTSPNMMKDFSFKAIAEEMMQQEGYLSSASDHEEETISQKVSEEEQDEEEEHAANDTAATSTTAEEQMRSTIREGSRIAIFWPLDAAYYEGTVEDRLQDNFFYVRYDDGESEWLDLTKHDFKVVTHDAATATSAKRGSKKKDKSSRGKKEKGERKNKKKNKKKEKKSSSRVSRGRGGGTRSKRTTSTVRNHQVLDAIRKYGHQWELVAEEVPGWNADDCERRWDLYLDPTLSREPFTEEEVREILSFQATEGNDWTVVAPRLNRRSCPYLSDRWNKKFRPIVVEYLTEELGFTLAQIEGDEKKRINYQGHFDDVVAVVMAAKP